MFDRAGYCQRYFMRKEAGLINYVRNIFRRKGAGTAPAGGAGISGEGRHADLSTSLLGGPEMVPAVAIGGSAIAATES